MRMIFQQPCLFVCCRRQEQVVTTEVLSTARSVWQSSGKLSTSSYLWRHAAVDRMILRRRANSKPYRLACNIPAALLVPGYIVSPLLIRASRLYACRKGPGEAPLSSLLMVTTQTADRITQPPYKRGAPARRIT